MFPSRSVIRDCADDVRRTQWLARESRRRLRLSAREFAVSPPVLLGSVLAGFVAGRTLVRSQARTAGAGTRPLKHLGTVLTLLRFF